MYLHYDINRCNPNEYHEMQETSFNDEEIPKTNQETNQTSHPDLLESGLVQYLATDLVREALKKTNMNLTVQRSEFKHKMTEEETTHETYLFIGYALRKTSDIAFYEKKMVLQNKHMRKFLN
jgi:hypothetical protein